MSSDLVQTSTDCQCQIFLERNIVFQCIFKPEYFTGLRASLALCLTEPSGLGRTFPAGTEGQPYSLYHGRARFWGKALPKILLLPPARRISAHLVMQVCLLLGTGAESLRARASLLAEGAGEAAARPPRRGAGKSMDASWHLIASGISRVACLDVKH